jgi:hypothetical protein
VVALPKAKGGKVKQLAMLFLGLGLAACTTNVRTCYKPVQASHEEGHILVVAPCPATGEK